MSASCIKLGGGVGDSVSEATVVPRRRENDVASATLFSSSSIVLGLLEILWLEKPVNHPWDDGYPKTSHNPQNPSKPFPGTLRDYCNCPDLRL